MDGDYIGNNDFPAIHFGREGWHGIITYNTLIDQFSPVDIIYAPEKCTKRFTWYATIPSGQVRAGYFQQENIVFLCHSDAVVSLLENYPTCFCLVAINEGEDYSWIEESRYKGRLLVFKEERRFYFYDMLLQHAFVNQLLWHREMDRIVFSGGTLDELIEVSESTLKNFLCITDTGFNLIACTRHTKMYCKEHPYLVENRCLSEKAVEHLRRVVLPLSTRSRKTIVDEPFDDNRDFPILHYPIYIDDQYLFHVAMECKNGSEAALKDLFEEFMKRVVQVATTFWRNTVNLESPWHRVLVGLIDGEQATQNYLNMQLSLTEIPKAHQFRLMYVPFRPQMGNQERNEVLVASKKMNQGMSYPFVYKGNLVVLLYSTSLNEDALCRNVIYGTVTDNIYSKFGLSVGLSQAFSHIEDIGFAYTQATLAFEFRKPLRKEFVLSCEEENVSVYPFEHALKYYMLSPDCDREVVRRSFKGSILSRLVEEDAEAGTEIAHLLWIYLSCDRNATETAKRVHVHRNTVLYHVGRIEKRFGLDFSSPMLKVRMILDYVELIFNNAV